MAARAPLRLHLRLRLRRWPRPAAAIAPRVWRRARSVEEGAPRRRQGRRLAPGPRPAPPRPTTDCPMASAQTFNAVRVGCWLLSCLVTRWPSPVRLAARGPLACSPPPPRFPRRHACLLTREPIEGVRAGGALRRRRSSDRARSGRCSAPPLRAPAAASAATPDAPPFPSPVRLPRVMWQCARAARPGVCMAPIPIPVRTG